MRPVVTRLIRCLVNKKGQDDEDKERCSNANYCRYYLLDPRHPNGLAGPCRFAAIYGGYHALVSGRQVSVII